jgi:hypothetical protein
MSGEQISVVLRYGVDENNVFKLNRSLVFPMLRTLPNNTHASLTQRFHMNIPSLLIVNGLSLENQRAKSISLDGKLTVVSTCEYANMGEAHKKTPGPVIELTQEVFPSTTDAALIEIYSIKNISDKPLSILVPEYKATYRTDPATGLNGAYILDSYIQQAGLKQVAPGESTTFSACITGRKNTSAPLRIDAETQKEARESFVEQMWSKLVLETPDEILNKAFAFAKIRACESIYKTAGGYMHSPGGEAFYAAIWANDQAEYINPFFPYVGYQKGNESALNAFRHFARFTNAEYKPIPSSIIAEGTDFWNGAGDRGDMAMIAYGAARYALALGNYDTAKELWPLITWCLEYCNRKLNAQGVVASDSDELEGRFPAGNANLCTSSLYYDALISAAYLGREILQNAALANKYKAQAKQLRKNIESWFGSNVQGFDTYRYYEGNDVLRSWICIPLTVGIDERSEATINALFSPFLWTDNGLLTQSGGSVFWDRSTLYGLRAAYMAGYTEKATHYLKAFSTKRLLGDHVPYPVEAYPEGEQRHLSAESGLYCRVITEGLFGIRPTGLRSFTLTPRLPAAWDEMKLRNLSACETVFDLIVKRTKAGLECQIIREGNVVQKTLVKEGKTVKVNFFP